MTPTEARALVPPAHPAAELLPWFSDEELVALGVSIRKIGQKEPITLIAVDGSVLVLDGRNRYAACILEGIQPQTAIWLSGEESAIEYVKAKNLLRRHLEPGQRAMIATDLERLYQAEARARQAAGGRHKGEEQKADGPKKADDGRALAQAAKEAGAGIGSSKKAKQVRRDAPEVAPLIRDGKITVQEGARLAALPEAERHAEVERINRGGKPAKPKPASASKPDEQAGRPFVATLFPESEDGETPTAQPQRPNEAAGGPVKQTSLAAARILGERHGKSGVAPFPIGRAVVDELRLEGTDAAGEAELLAAYKEGLAEGRRQAPPSKASKADPRVALSLAQVGDHFAAGKREGQGEIFAFVMGLLFLRGVPEGEERDAIEDEIARLQAAAGEAAPAEDEDAADPPPGED